jgi:hypothetical protein
VLLTLPSSGQHGPDSLVFWGYELPAVLPFLDSILLHCGRLVVALDLDHTLIYARTLKDLREMAKKCE